MVNLPKEESEKGEEEASPFYKFKQKSNI